MNTNFTLKNIRVLDEKGATVQLKPLTILTGCNSSGKSTIARSTLLLNSFLSQIRKDLDNSESIELNKYNLDFTIYPNNLFGTFENVVHEGSSKHQITLGYSVYSHILSKDVDVQFVFSSKKEDVLQNAYLNSITISTDRQVFFSSSKEGGTTCNLEILKDACVEFLPIEYVVHQFCGLESEYEFGHRLSKQEYEEEREKMLSFLSECDAKRRRDIIRYIRTSSSPKVSIVSRKKAKLDVLEWTMEHDSLFMIPIVERLETLSKEEIESAIDEFVDKGNSSMVEASKRIINDFIASNFASFGDYFRNYEHDYLSNINVSFISNRKAPILINYRDLGINQDYVFKDLCYASFDLIDKDGNRSKPKPSKEKLIEEHRDLPLSFPIIYEILMAWNANYTQEESLYYSALNTELGGTYYRHEMYTLLSMFTEDLLREVICPDWCGNMEYVRSDRAIVKRLYTLESNDDFTKLLKKYIESKRVFLEKDKYSSWSQRGVYEVDRFINHWIEEFGIGKSLKINVEAEGWGVSIRNYKNKRNKGRLLADEGYGITQLVSILLQIEFAIQSAQGLKVNRYFGLDDLDGYGKKKFQYEIRTIVIEEPEIHLHPSYQSMLAEMFVDAYKKYNIHFIIETHSEYLIRKLQTLVAKEEVKADDISILYVYSPSIEERPLYAPQIETIGVKPDGRLTDSFGPGFFDEADNRAMELLTIKEQNQ